MSSLPWYKEGLRFECTGCGRCCSGGPGRVWVEEEEMQKMAELLKLNLEDFKEKYTKTFRNRHCLLETSTSDGNFDCVFLKDKKCQVYQSRPLQCKTYPFWRENLRTEQNWKKVESECEGINAQSQLIPLSEIVERMFTS